MMILLFITVASFFIWSIRNALFWVALWQTKEYRFDRIRAHLLETRQGRALIFSPILFLKLVGILCFGFIAFNYSYLPLYQVFICAVFTFEAVRVLEEIFKSRIKRPIPTVKSLGILFVTLWTVFVFFSFPLVDMFVWLLIIDRFIPLLVALFVFILMVPSDLSKDWYIEKAYKKLQKYSKKNRDGKTPLVIGVTGSYAKSSTKEFIAQILEKKFTVLKTPETKNTPIGVARTILTGLKQNTQIFVVEMGAYKRGEIAEICRLVRPDIGVLTAVSTQHLSLFGSIDNTKKAKYELIDALPETGVALFNGNNKNAVELYSKTEKKKILYFAENKQTKELEAQVKKNSSMKATHITVGKTWIGFNTTLKGRQVSFKAPLIGRHNVENILPAIYIANFLGMSTRDIQEAVSTLAPLQKTMVFHKLISGATIVNDTYNTSPDAVRAALSYMKLYKGKKIMVLEPMIELGKEAKKENFQIAQEISQVCDYLLLTKNNLYDVISQGVVDGEGNCIVKVATPSEIEEFLVEQLGKEDIVVFEGREAVLAFNKIV